MTETRFTPGPWAVCEHGYAVIVEGSDAYVGYPPREGAIASLFDGEYIENGNYVADAHLIAAAPELYEAAAKAKDALQPFADRVFYDNGEVTVTNTHTLTVDEWADAYFAVRSIFAALSKAGGQS